MKCVICKQGETNPGTTSVTLERGTSTFVFKNVPADVCSNCGEEYVDNNTTETLLKVAEESAMAGVQVDIRHYVAA